MGKLSSAHTVHTGCAWTIHVHVGPTSLKVSTPSQNTKINAKREEGNAREVSVYLLGPNKSLFHPLKLLKSTISAKVCFLTFGQFSIYNGDNELSTFYL
jgi:hypothetical protein